MQKSRAIFVMLVYWANQIARCWTLGQDEGGNREMCASDRGMVHVLPSSFPAFHVYFRYSKCKCCIFLNKNTTVTIVYYSKYSFFIITIVYYRKWTVLENLKKLWYYRENYKTLTTSLTLYLSRFNKLTLFLLNSRYVSVKTIRIIKLYENCVFNFVFYAQKRFEKWFFDKNVNYHGTLSYYSKNYGTILKTTEL